MNHQLASQALKAFGLDTGLGISHLEACDNNKSSQKLLVGMELDHGNGVIRKILHVRVEIIERVGPVNRKWLQQIFPEMKPEEVKKRGGPSQDGLDAQLAAAREVLQEGEVFATDRKLCCKACDTQECTVPGWAYSRSDGITIFIGGFTCKDWSQRGTSMGCGGRSFAPFLVMAFEIRCRKPGVGILECSEYQPDSLLVALLGDLYWIDSAVLCPKFFGIPVRRRRKWRITGCKPTTLKFGIRLF